MPDDQKIPEKRSGLSKEFKEFSFDSPKPAPPPPIADGPVKLTKEDLDFEPYRGINGGGRSIPIRDLDEEERIAQEEEDTWAQHDYEVAQERTFDAAGVMFRNNREVTSALTMLSNLEMQSVVTAGILCDNYEKNLPERRVNDMMIAALALNAANFDDICGRLSPECVGMVDELLMMAAEPEKDLRILQAQNLEPDSKRVLLAMTIADLEMALHEMHDMGDDGPIAEEMADIADVIQAVGPGVDRNLRRRAIDTFNIVSTATNNGATLKETPEGGLVLNDMPDIHVPAPKSQAKKIPVKRGPQRKR